VWKTPDDAWSEFKLVPKDKQEDWFKAAIRTCYWEGGVPFMRNDIDMDAWMDVAND
jgi:hypothetical protein